ncbi:ABC transporter permease subunit [Clostridium sp. YIM B02505]|uniref:ABC transporter permease subunit n=1 Tax=Clostridium yunnanense TaxID=2800325 RepID=A0ABS1EQY2_9CLOT|nr:ABC transporter permease subunit [Clostridium yunnanense]MBK1811745.1 ABC transporter permease subunit [Clostridium yunnanense]
MKSKHKRKVLLTDVSIYAFLAIFIVITMIPAWWILSLSLENGSGIVSTQVHLLPKHFTLDNYKTVLGNADFLMWAKNSLIFSGGSTIAALFIAVLAAYGFSRFSFPGKKFGMLMFIIFMMLPMTAALLPQYLLMQKLRLTNTYIGMILMYTAGAQTFAIWNLKGFFDTIPRDLDEAATVDGASRWRIFTDIIIPLSKPAIAVTTVIIFLGPWTDFAGIFMFISDPDKYTLAMGLSKWGSDFRSTPWPIFAASSFIVAGPITALYMLLQLGVKNGLTVGAVKG